MDLWLRALAPSLVLYTRYTGNMISWDEFVTGYYGELDRKREFFTDLQDHSRNGGLTLVHGSRNEDRNPAIALRMLLEKR